MKTLALSLPLIAALLAGPALGQAQPAPSRGHSDAAPSLGFEPMMLEVGEGERLSFPRSYEQEACPETVIRRIFRTELEDDFVASLRCWSVPIERSSEFVQALDQALPAAGWEFVSGAGMGAKYVKAGKELDVLIFGYDQFGDEPGQTDVGYLFGVVETSG